MRWLAIGLVVVAVATGLLLLDAGESTNQSQGQPPIEATTTTQSATEATPMATTTPDIRSVEQAKQAMAIAEADPLPAPAPVGEWYLEPLDGQYYYPISGAAPGLANAEASAQFSPDDVGAQLAAVHLVQRCGLAAPTVYDCLDNQATGPGVATYRNAVEDALAQTGRRPGEDTSQALKSIPVGTALTAPVPDPPEAGDQVVVNVGFKVVTIDEGVMSAITVEWNGSDWDLVIPIGDQPWPIWTVPAWPRLDLVFEGA